MSLVNTNITSLILLDQTHPHLIRVKYYQQYHYNLPG